MPATWDGPSNTLTVSYTFPSLANAQTIMTNYLQAHGVDTTGMTPAQLASRFFQIEVSRIRSEAANAQAAKDASATQLASFGTVNAISIT